MSMKNPLTPAWIEQATFRFVAHHLNHCATAVPLEGLYNEFKARGFDTLELPTQNVVLKSAFTGRTNRVKMQALVKLQIKNVSLDQIILISPQLFTSLLLGMYFCMDNHVDIDFPKKMLVINADD